MFADSLGTVLAAVPDEDSVGVGLLGVLIVLGLVVGCVLLFRSMLHHLRKVPPSFERPVEGDDSSG